MSNLLVYIESILLFIFGSCFFMFVYWRRLREDYARDTIFNGAFLVLISIYFLGLLVKIISVYVPGFLIFRPEGLWFWGSFIGFNLSIYWYANIKNIMLSESYEAAVVGLLPTYIAVVFVDSLFPYKLYSFIYSLVLVTSLFVYLYLSRHYKKFSWYRSGKVGLAGLATLGLVFFARGVIAVFDPTVISFVGRIEIVLSGLVSFVMFFTIYNLSTK